MASIVNSYKSSFVLALEYQCNKCMKIFKNTCKGKLNRSIALKLLNPLNLPEELVKLIIQTSLLTHTIEKNDEDVLNDLIIESINHKVESLDFPELVTCNKEDFTCRMYTNIITYLLFLGISKGILKFLLSFTIVIGIDKDLHTSTDKHLLLLTKLKINYLPSQLLKDGLPI